MFPLAALPDDPGFADQFPLWNPGGLSMNTVRSWPFVPSGREVVVAVLDSGVRWKHPDLGGDSIPPDGPPGGVFWRNEAEAAGLPGVDDDGNGFVDDVFGWDFVDVVNEDTLGTVSVASGEDGSTPDNDPTDFAGHGTKVAGLITALVDNGSCIAGLPPGVRIMPLRVGWADPNGNGFVFMSYCAQALEYAARNGARVANCSWDSDTSFGMVAALDFAVGVHDVVVVGSAGNWGNSSTGPEYLSSREDCLGVAGILPWGRKLGISNYGPWVDIAAFAQGMRTTTYEGFNDSTGCNLVTFGGTSFAAPLVAGEAALLRIVDPTAPSAVVRDLVRTHGRDLHDVEPTYADQLGGGLADVAAAVQAMGGGWDDAELPTRALTPFGFDGTPTASLAGFSGNTLLVRDGADGGDVPGWEGGAAGLAAPAKGMLPLATAWGVYPDPTLIWVEADTLHAARAPGAEPAGWPLPLPSATGQPAAAAGAAGDVVFVPLGEDVLRVGLGVDPAPEASLLGWPAERLAAGQLDADPDPEVAGIDAGGTLRVWEEGADALSGWSADLGPITVGPVLAELESAGNGWIAAGGPDTTNASRQVVHLVGPGGSPHLEVTFDAPPLTALSGAGFASGVRVEIVAVDEAGGLHLVDVSGLVGEADAGGAVAGEVLCADVDGDWSSDLLALRSDGTLFAWDADLQPLPGFPRRFPFGFAEAPLVLDASGRRYVAAADTTGWLWSLPVGEAGRPAPWPAARGGGRRGAFLGHERATPVESATATLTWDGLRPCWSGTGLEAYAALRLRIENAVDVLWQGPPGTEGCAATEAKPGTPVVLEGNARTGAWDPLARGVAPAGRAWWVGSPVPNPFRSESVLRWSGAEAGVRIEVFDVQGRRVLAVDRTEREGSFRWEGQDEAGRALPGGLYFLRLREGSRSEVRRLIKVP